MSLSQISMLPMSHVVDHMRPIRRFEHRGRALSAQDEKQGSRPDAGLWGSIRELDSGTKGSTLCIQVLIRMHVTPGFWHWF